jgi:hypothetical protein
VDDSTRPLFDSADFRFLEGEKSPWPWVMERPANEKPGAYSDWYFFGYGHDYKQALGDFVRVAGRIPLPPRFAFGVWWSRYWAYTDEQFDELARDFRENDTPLDVMVIDMDWHMSDEQLRAMGAVDQSGEMLGWTGYTWNKVLFPDPDAFLKKLHEDGLKTTMNLHPASGIQPWEQAYPAMARAMGSIRRRRNTFRSIRRTRNGRRIIWTWCCIRWRSRAWTSGGLTGSSSRRQICRA